MPGKPKYPKQNGLILTWCAATTHCKHAQGQQKQGDATLYALVPWRGSRCFACFGLDTTRETTSHPNSDCTAPKAKAKKAMRRTKANRMTNRTQPRRGSMAGLIGGSLPCFFGFIRCTCASCTPGNGGGGLRWCKESNAARPQTPRRDGCREKEEAVGEAWCAGLWLCLVLSVSRPPPPASLPALPLYYLVVCLPRTQKHDTTTTQWPWGE